MHSSSLKMAGTLEMAGTFTLACTACDGRKHLQRCRAGAKLCARLEIWVK